MRHLAAAVVLVLLVAACSATSSTESADPATSESATAPTVTPEPSVSFASEVQPVLVETCARCHTGDGPGTPHLRVDTAADVVEAADDIALAVAARVMPPWPASSESIEFQHNWSLDAAQIDAVVRWHRAGDPLDVDPTSVIAPAMGTVALADADVELVSASAYDGEAGQPDMYRCIVYDPDLTTRSYIEAVEFAPDQTTVVHHAIGFTLPESSRARADELDAQNGGTGWPCFGSSGLPSEKRFLAWAPGQVFTDYGEGAGFAMDAGDFFVIQIHYHFEEDAPADYSELRVRWADDTTDIAPITVNQFLAPAEIPCTATESGPLCDRPAAMAKALQSYGPGGALADIILSLCGQRPADFAAMTEGIASSSCDGRVEAPGQIVSVLGHEHELGASFRMTLNPETPHEMVLLDIPKWDFEWQFNYEPVEEIIIDSSDVVRIECSWDRSLRNPELEPAYVLWADGTNDEMCFATIITRAVT